MNARRSNASTALLAGGTGLIGRELAQQLLADTPRPALHLLVRRVPAGADARANWLPVDFAALPALPAADAAFFCLGTTLKQAGSQAAFRAVDYDAVRAFARAARTARATRFAVVCSLGASARSAGLYNRVKGEMEAAVGTLGIACAFIARPSLLACDRAVLGQPMRAAERLALLLTGPVAGLIPKSMRPINAYTVARAMIEALRQARRGVRIVESGALRALGQA